MTQKITKNKVVEDEEETWTVENSEKTKTTYTKPQLELAITKINTRIDKLKKSLATFEKTKKGFQDILKTK